MLNSLISSYCPVSSRKQICPQYEDHCIALSLYDIKDLFSIKSTDSKPDFQGLHFIKKC